MPWLGWDFLADSTSCVLLVKTAGRSQFYLLLRHVTALKTISVELSWAQLYVLDPWLIFIYTFCYNELNVLRSPVSSSSKLSNMKVSLEMLNWQPASEIWMFSGSLNFATDVRNKSSSRTHKLCRHHDTILHIVPFICHNIFEFQSCLACIVFHLVINCIN